MTRKQSNEDREAKFWRDEIADRIDNLVKFSGKTNTDIAKDPTLNVTKEAVRQWRAGDTWPRMDKVKPLAALLRTTPEYILLGIHQEKGVDSLRERICRNDAELALLRLFRATNREGKNLTVEAARSYSITHPAPHNVVQLKERRSK